MGDDAHTPQAPDNASAHRPAQPGDAARDPWAAPADQRPEDAAGSPAYAQEAPARVPLDKPEQSGAGPRPEPNPWAPPANGAAAGPAATVADAGSQAPPSASVHNQQTVTAFPGVGGTPPADAVRAPQPWASPFAPPNPAAPVNGSANPFAPPAAAPPHARVHDEPVPPPPIAPDGPGQVPYGYPGAYGYPPQPGYGGPGAQPQGYYGWPGLTPVPSNGMGTTALVLGIIAAVVFCLWPLAILLGIMAIIFGMVGRAKAGRGEATNPGQALAGIICGAAGVVLGLVIIAFLIAGP